MTFFLYQFLVWMTGADTSKSAEVRKTKRSGVQKMTSRNMKAKRYNTLICFRRRILSTHILSRILPYVLDRERNSLRNKTEGKIVREKNGEMAYPIAPSVLWILVFEKRSSACPNLTLERRLVPVILPLVPTQYHGIITKPRYVISSRLAPILARLLSSPWIKRNE